MKLRMKQDFECYIHTDLKNYKKNQIIEKPSKYEIAMLLDKHDVAEVYKEPKEDKGDAKKGEIANEKAPDETKTEDTGQSKGEAKTSSKKKSGGKKKAKPKSAKR